MWDVTRKRIWSPRGFCHDCISVVLRFSRIHCTPKNAAESEATCCMLVWSSMCGVYHLMFQICQYVQYYLQSHGVCMDETCLVASWGRSAGFVARICLGMAWECWVYDDVIYMMVYIMVFREIRYGLSGIGVKLYIQKIVSYSSLQLN